VHYRKPTSPSSFIQRLVCLNLYSMKNEEKVKLKHAKAIDVKGIIELLTQLERPLPKDNFYKKIGFQQIAEVFEKKLGK
jgi:hypothetical protein